MKIPEDQQQFVKHTVQLVWNQPRSPRSKSLESPLLPSLIRQQVVFNAAKNLKVLSCWYVIG